MKKIEYTDNDRFFIDPIGVTFVEENEKDTFLESTKKESPKQNMSLDGFTTTKDLDLQLESILKSIEPDVIAAIEKITPRHNQA